MSLLPRPFGEVPGEAYFPFAPVKVRGCHGGPGRAIVLH
jgi:hypothetical protein